MVNNTQYLQKLPISQYIHRVKNKLRIQIIYRYNCFLFSSLIPAQHQFTVSSILLKRKLSSRHIFPLSNRKNAFVDWAVSLVMRGARPVNRDLTHSRRQISLAIEILTRRKGRRLSKQSAIWLNNA